MNNKFRFTGSDFPLSENGRERLTLKLFEPGAHHLSFVFLHPGLNAFVAFPFIPCPTGPISSQTQKCYFCNFLLIYTKFLKGMNLYITGL